MALCVYRSVAEKASVVEDRVDWLNAILDAILEKPHFNQTTVQSGYWCALIDLDEALRRLGPLSDEEAAAFEAAHAEERRYGAREPSALTREALVFAGRAVAHLAIEKRWRALGAEIRRVVAGVLRHLEWVEQNMPFSTHRVWELDSALDLLRMTIRQLASLTAEEADAFVVAGAAVGWPRRVPVVPLEAVVVACRLVARLATEKLQRAEALRAGAVPAGSKEPPGVVPAVV